MNTPIIIFPIYISLSGRPFTYIRVEAKEECRELAPCVCVSFFLPLCLFTLFHILLCTDTPNYKCCSEEKKNALFVVLGGGEDFAVNEFLRVPVFCWCWCSLFIKFSDIFFFII